MHTSRTFARHSSILMLVHMPVPDTWLCAKELKRAMREVVNAAGGPTGRRMSILDMVHDDGQGTYNRISLKLPALDKHTMCAPCYARRNGFFHSMTQYFVVPELVSIHCLSSGGTPCPPMDKGHLPPPMKTDSYDFSDRQTSTVFPVQHMGVHTLCFLQRRSQSSTSPRSSSWTRNWTLWRPRRGLQLKLATCGDR